MASSFFKVLLSLPQPPDSESIDGLPVVQLSEDAELLNCLMSILYPVRPVIPNSYEKVLYLLAACQKYDMIEVQSFIRTEVSRGVFPAPLGAEVFRAYAIARGKELIPEMEYAARLTLDYPMTFEALGEGLRLLDGCALRDLARFRKRCRDKLATCLEPFLEGYAPGPSCIWVGCPSHNRHSSRRHAPQAGVLPSWLRQVLSRNNDELISQVFTHPLTTPSNIRGKYTAAIQGHTGCSFCLGVHVTKGSTYCAELESKLALALDQVHTSFLRRLKYLRIHPRRYAMIRC